MLGGEFLSHGSQQAAGVTVIDADFPGLRHAGPRFSITEEWYSLKNFASDLHVLLVLETAAMQEPEYRRPVFPLAWARHEGEGRVYYNAMGHRADVWSSAGFREMLAGAVAWVIGDAEARIAANMAEVTPQAAVLPPE
jgi:type 1 glutamine amidotransferase